MGGEVSPGAVRVADDRRLGSGQRPRVSSPAGAKGAITFDGLMALGRATAPALVSAPRRGARASSPPRGRERTGRRRCWAQASRRCRDLGFHIPMQAFATSDTLKLLSTADDHVSAIMAHGAEDARYAFLEEM